MAQFDHTIMIRQWGPIAKQKLPSEVIAMVTHQIIELGNNSGYAEGLYWEFKTTNTTPKKQRK